MLLHTTCVCGTQEGMLAVLTHESKQQELEPCGV